MTSALAIGGIVPASRLGERPAPATVFTGIAELDALTGGLPRGALSEICGPATSGRTSVLFSLMAAMTQREEVCALVDAGDSFHPHSAAAAGVDLRRVLWVRCEKNSPPKRGDAGRNLAGFRAHSVGGKKSANGKSAMPLLEQALKATDLLLQGGGFGLVVVDLGDISPDAARRIPLTSWFRFRRAVENTATVLLVLEQEPYAKTCASVVLKLSASGTPRSTAHAQPGGCPAHARILDGLEIQAEFVRHRLPPKKPSRPVGAHWESQTPWVV